MLQISKKERFEDDNKVMVSFSGIDAKYFHPIENIIRGIEIWGSIHPIRLLRQIRGRVIKSLSGNFVQEWGRRLERLHIPNFIREYLRVHACDGPCKKILLNAFPPCRV